MEFSVKSTYTEISRNEQSKMDKHWDMIWKWPGTQRNRTFMWLCVRDKILTNTQRKKRNLTSGALCPICRAKDKSVLHAIRDCSVRVDLWKIIVNPAYWQEFFSDNII